MELIVPACLLVYEIQSFRFQVRVKRDKDMDKVIFHQSDFLFFLYRSRHNPISRKGIKQSVMKAE